MFFFDNSPSFRRLSKIQIAFPGWDVFFFFPFSVFNLGAIQYSTVILYMVYMVIKEFTEGITFFHKILALNSITVHTTQK